MARDRSQPIRPPGGDRARELASAPGNLSPASFLAAAGLWLIACLWFPLTDTDIWWHLASAKLMWARKAFLREDPFCLVSFGVPWADLHWGFQCLSYAAWKLGGAQALVAGKCLAVAGALGLALKPHLDRRTLPWLIPLAAFGIYQVRFFIDVRPLALTLLGLAIQYAAAVSHLRGGLRRPWLILIPTQIALVNIQGLYPLGALLVTCLLLGEAIARRAAGKPRKPAEAGPAWDRPTALMGLSAPGTDLRPLAWTVAVLWLCGFASPYGKSGFALPLSLLGRIAPVPSNIFSREIAENLPLLDLIRHHPWEALPFLVLGGAVVYTFLRARKRTSPGHVLLFLAFAALGWMAQRNLPLALLAGLMAAGRNLQVSPVRLPAYAGWAALAAVALSYGPKVRAAWEYELPGSLETPFRFPVPAVAYLENHPLPGNLFNELRYGGYLEFRLYPRTLAFVDGRMILRTPEFYRGFLEAVDHPEGFEAYRARYGITHALLPISEDRRFLPLAAHLLRDGWTLLYCDGASALLADSATVAAAKPPILPVHQAISDRFGANPRLQAMATANAVEFLGAAARDEAPP